MQECSIDARIYTIDLSFFDDIKCNGGFLIEIFFKFQFSNYYTMNTSDVDVITLDDSDDDDEVIGFSSSNTGPVYREEQMIRCNFCVDPGLLPVEGDRADHRRNLHGNKLFYCDVCRPGEKGAKGFEEYTDIKKHVSRENGIRENDTANLHNLIRIPSKAEYLKTFRYNQTTRNIFFSSTCNIFLVVW